MKMVYFWVLTASIVFAGSVYAGAYVGAGAGRSDIDASDNGVSFEDSDTGWKVFAGYAFNEYFAVEGAWVDFGDFNDNIFDPFFGISLPVSLDLDGFSVSGVGSYPIGESASVFGKVGVWSWDVDAKALGISSDDSGTDVMFGVGGSYSFTDALSVRAEWERFKADSDDADLISISGVFSF